MYDTDPWTDTAVPDWSAEQRVQFDRSDPAKTIPLSWAQDMIMRWRDTRPDHFGKELAVTVRAWSTAKTGSDEHNGGQ